MRKPAILSILLIGAVAFAQEKKSELKLSDDEKAVVEATNEERKKAGLSELKPNAKLFEAARNHAANMAKQEKLDHTLDGKTASERVKDAGYEYGRTGENIAHNSPTPQDAVASWMGSEMHKANMLEKDYADLGVAVAKNAKGERYWVQVFGKPLR